MDKIDSTIFTIATGKYLDYFALNLEQIVRHYAPGKRLQIIVATDRLEARPVSPDRRVRIDYVSIETYPWPEITLFRYEQILAHRHLIAGETLMWLDTDMAILRDIPFELIMGNGTVPYVSRHPAFNWNWRLAPWHNPWKMLRVLHPWLQAWSHWLPGYGSWEVRRGSKAFVSRRKRRLYFAGGVWGGATDPVLKMVELLAARTREDYAEGVIAVHNDESHLNWYAAHYPVKIYPREFCVWDKHWWFDAKRAYINCLEKEGLDEFLKNSARF